MQNKKGTKSSVLGSLCNPGFKKSVTYVCEIPCRVGVDVILNARSSFKEQNSRVPLSS